jgi:hypothetical protein
MRHHLVSGLIAGIAVLLAAASVAAEPKSTSNETTAQTETDSDKTKAQSQVIIAEDSEEATEDGEEYTENPGGILYDELVKAKSQRALFSKIRSESRPLMDSWLGADECALVDKWGSSGNAYNARTARYLTYVYGYHAQYVTRVDEDRNVFKNLPDRFFCNVTFEVRGGIITDYRFEGNYCAANARGMARGPN